MTIHWNEIEDYVWDIIEKYRDSGIERVIGIKRGGLIPAVMISHGLGVPMEVLDFQLRDGDEIDPVAQNLKLLNQMSAFGDLSNTLFIDDICDTGESFIKIRDCRKEARFVVLVEKRSNLAEYSVLTLSHYDGWVTYPWEI